MNEHNENTSNSSVIQVLLDTRNLAITQNNPKVIQLANELLDELSSSYGLQKAIDEKFQSHKYPENKLCFIKKYNAIAPDTAIDSTDLSTEAKYLLEYMCERMSYQNLIGLKRDVIVKQTSLTRRNFDNAIDELITKGFIVVVHKHSRTNPTVYAVNSDYAHYSNFSNTKLFEININSQPVCILDQYKHIDYSVSTSSFINKNYKDYPTRYNYTDSVSEKD